MLMVNTAGQDGRGKYIKSYQKGARVCLLSRKGAPAAGGGLHTTMRLDTELWFSSAKTRFLVLRERP